MNRLCCEEVIDTTSRLGIGYFDSAQAYAGSQAYLGEFWRDNAKLRQDFFQTSKSATREKKGALSDLDNSLKTMGIEYLDLWQIHDLRNQADLQFIESPGGALEAFLEAREKGKVRFIGVTGHLVSTLKIQIRKAKWSALYHVKLCGGCC